MIKKNIRATAIKQSVNLRYMKNVLSGEPAFVLGNGPSLNDDDISPLKDFFTIGINRAFLALDPTVLFWQDAHLWYTEKTRILDSKAVKVCRDISDPQNRFNHFRLRTTDNFRLPEGPHILYGQGATGPLAVQFAYALGCDPIVLLGFDCKYRENKTDFYGINKHHKSYTLDNCTRGLHWIAGIKTDRQIINCSDNSVFKTRRRLPEILKEHRKPGKGRDNYVSMMLRHVQ